MFIRPSGQNSLFIIVNPQGQFMIDFIEDTEFDYLNLKTSPTFKPMPNGAFANSV